MIDPTKITNFEASEHELQELALFWICAAGKNGMTSARLLNNLLETLNPQKDLPFSIIAPYDYDAFSSQLKAHGIGCYSSKSRSMIDLARSGLDLRTCSVDDLETIYGIGMKTSRCFVMHSRPDVEVAALDTHVLKYLRAQGYDAPKQTPTKKKYIELEKIFIDIAKKEGKSIAGFDLEIWNAYAIK